MPVVGTAGHVDHGKSTLIEALTGRDPDRWDEEKQRGLTIDLGFAWMTLPDGTEISFVDVPGHQRFIKNMLAGIEAVDVALFVVAADEGWMPQSEEHLAVLDLLEVRHGVVAVTKTDRVDADLVELASLEVTERLAGTTLEGSPIVPVAAPSGRGIDTLLGALIEQVAAAVTAFDEATRPRLWIDRSFTISGSGTVVTGTLLGGPLGVGDEVEVWPGGERSRIRSVQSHEKALATARPHSRVAMNLAGTDRAAIVRGAMIGRPGEWRETSRFLVSVRVARYHEDPLDAKGAYHLHVGSGAQPVTIRPLDDLPDGSQVALLRVPQPLALAMGDRFIIRDVGRKEVVAGGVVLDPAPPRKGRDMRAAAPGLQTALAGSPVERADALLEVRGIEEADALFTDSGGRPDTMTVSGMAVSPRVAEELRMRIVEAIASFHIQNPLRPGMPKADLASRFGVPLAVLDAVIARADELRDVGPNVARHDFRPELTAQQVEVRDKLVEVLDAAGLAVPTIKELKVDSELLHALIRSGDLVRVGQDLVYLPSQIEAIRSGLATLPAPFTVAEFRDRFAISRKYAVPLLEWLDAQGVTVRHGDGRTVRNR